jgi:hypothetical protein
MDPKLLTQRSNLRTHSLGRAHYYCMDHKNLCNWSRGSSVNVVTRLQAGRPGFDSSHEQGYFLFATASGPALGPTQPPIQRVSKSLSLGVKRLGREADHSPQSSVYVTNVRKLELHSPILLSGVVLN